MANEAHKIKLLVLWDILCKNTDENHALNTDEISELLALRGLNVSRKILVQDIATLCDNGYDVLSYKKKYHYYYVVNRSLETAEVVMLADVINASKLPVAQKKALAQRLAETLCTHQAESISKHIISLDKGRRGNSSFIYNVDAIERAINENKQISFLYFNYDEKHKKVYRKNGNRYTVSPAFMVWNKDNYYLLCFSKGHDDIVKDMSRFGRNYLEVGYYTEVIFPEYDVQFIAVNDNVDSEVQTDNDFTPFRNIMNEWYAKDISKKMKSAIKAKGNSGKHTNPLPPYGYIKDPNDKNKWLIDEEAATVVRRIFGLCMQGFGPTQISRILTDEGVDTPKIHAKKMGRKVTIRANEMPEAWADQTVGAILGYWEYLGWTVNFKTKKKSFKSKKVILLPSDEWQVFKDTQEPIIDEETFWAVQKIREGKRRLDSLGEPNALSGMLFCGDCGHRLYLRRQRDPHQKDYFVCSVYRKKRKYFCTAHFIRLADIEKILLRDLRQVTAFAREHESEFLDLAKKRSLRETEKLRAENKASLDKAVRRIAEIDGIIQKLYEDNVSGKISDERFAKMTATYETEQNGLQQTAQRLKDDISAVREEGESVDRFMKLVNKYSDITELNAEIIRTFVEKIVVYEAEKNDGVKTQKVKIVYNCVGTVSVPNTDNEAVKTDKTKIIEVA